MLTHLYIKNFTLIDTLDIDFREGFSVITGETGAGKSIILGAINLRLEQLADTKQVKLGTQKCVIEAVFSPLSDTIAKEISAADESLEDLGLSTDDIILRRELTAAGKSRSFINDTPVPLTAMKAVGTMLIDIHSQHKNLLINDENFQLNVVDIIANNSKQLTDYQQDFNDYQRIKQQVQQLKQTIEES